MNIDEAREKYKQLALLYNSLVEKYNSLVQDYKNKQTMIDDLDKRNQSLNMKIDELKKSIVEKEFIINRQQETISRTSQTKIINIEDKIDTSSIINFELLGY